MKPTVLTKARLAEAAAQLAAKDSDLALILERYGPPPMWQRQPGFATLIHIILEQQVSLAAAASMFARLKQHIDPLDPERVLQLGEPQLRSLGLTRQKTAYCLHLAETVASNRLKLGSLSRLDDETVRTATSPDYFAYRLTEFSSRVIRMLVREANGQWWFTDEGPATRAKWTFSLEKPEVSTSRGAGRSRPWRLSEFTSAAS